MKKLINWFVKSACNRTIGYFNYPANGGRRRFFLGGYFRIYMLNQGVGKFTKLGFPLPELQHTG